MLKGGNLFAQINWCYPVVVILALVSGLWSRKLTLGYSGIFQIVVIPISFLTLVNRYLIPDLVSYSWLDLSFQIVSQGMRHVS